MDDHPSGTRQRAGGQNPAYRPAHSLQASDQHIYVKGARITVALVLGLIADGMSEQDVLREYPQLTEPDVRACLAYGAKLAAGRLVEVA